MVKNGFVSCEMLEEFIKTSLAKTVLNLQNRHILKKHQLNILFININSIYLMDLLHQILG